MSHQNKNKKKTKQNQPKKKRKIFTPAPRLKDGWGNIFTGFKSFKQ